MNISNLSSFSVFENSGLRPGQAAMLGKNLVMHPLDVISVTTPNPIERLPVAMSWLLGQADKKFSAAERRLALASLQ